MIRPFPLRRAAAWLLGCAVAAGAMAAPAGARTILDRRALDALTAGGLPLPPPAPPGPPATEAPMSPAPPAAAHGLAPSRPLAPAVPAPLPMPGPVPPAPVLPPPPIVVPVRPAPPPGKPQIAADAAGSASRLPDGLRLTFGAGAAMLNPASAAALSDFARAAPANAVFTLSAFAAGAVDDPSTPRRLALSRALAVRGILLGDGIASARILVRALGASKPAIDAGPPDRVDVTIPAPGG
jgi:outer membrane protein OmpA-like peptidoglycan-associated protein